MHDRPSGDRSVVSRRSPGPAIAESGGRRLGTGPPLPTGAPTTWPERSTYRWLTPSPCRGPDLGHRQDPHASRPASSPRSRRAPSSAGRRHHRAGHRQRRQGASARASTSSRSPSTSRSGCTPPGKIPGSFFRREGRPDRARHPHLPPHRPPAAPVVPRGFRNETQVVATVLGADLENPHDVARHQRRLGRAHALGHPVRRPDRRRAPRLQPGRHVDPAPDLRGGRRVAPSSSSSPAASSTTATSPS